MAIRVRAHPNLYPNVKKACRTEVNANECQKVCSAFATQANEHAFHWLFVGCPNECTSTSVWWRTYFSLKYRLQTDSVCLFTSEWRQMLFAYASTLCVLHAFRVHVRCGCGFMCTNMWMFVACENSSFAQRRRCTNVHASGEARYKHKCKCSMIFKYSLYTTSSRVPYW